MKNALLANIDYAINELKKIGVLPKDIDLAPLQIERCRDKQHGDFASNIAMSLAKVAKRAPREVAELIVEHLPQTDVIKKVEIAGPGFINFFLDESELHSVVSVILEQQAAFGRSSLGEGQKIHIEFVSSNPTGPLHVGHGRSAAYGAAVSDLLAAVGYDVFREYYVNDAGRQMDILAVSTWLRYLELHGECFAFPSNGYKGDYVTEIARKLKDQYQNRFFHPTAEIFEKVSPDESQAGGDKERHIDDLIDSARVLLGKEDYQIVFESALKTNLDDIREDLAEFGVTYQHWYSERELEKSNAIARAIERLTAQGHTYEKEGALWFNSAAFGDDKDRVLVRQNGRSTYFASDVAYHMEKFERGFSEVIDVFGSDHHGYLNRMTAAIKALGGDPTRFKTIIVQFAILYRGSERLQMSTRSGSFVTLRELRQEVGNDAARFFYVMRKNEQHLDFDLDLAKSQSNENPVYYIQYAHARICSIFRQLEEKKLHWDQGLGLAELASLTESHEQILLTELARYPEIVESAAKHYEPHQLAHYLRDLANAFHTYYNAHQFIVDDTAIRNARLCLIVATRHVLANGLTLLGVSAPEQM